MKPFCAVFSRSSLIALSLLAFTACSQSAKPVTNPSAVESDSSKKEVNVSSDLCKNEIAEVPATWKQIELNALTVPANSAYNLKDIQTYSNITLSDKITYGGFVHVSITGRSEKQDELKIEVLCKNEWEAAVGGKAYAAPVLEMADQFKSDLLISRNLQLSIFRGNSNSDFQYFDVASPPTLMGRKYTAKSEKYDISIRDEFQIYQVNDQEIEIRSKWHAGRSSDSKPEEHWVIAARYQLQPLSDGFYIKDKESNASKNTELHPTAKTDAELKALLGTLVDQEVKRFNADQKEAKNQIQKPSELLDWINTLAQNTAFDDVRAYKVALEKSISPGSEIIYNKAFSSVGHVYRFHKLNCMSGTYTFFFSLLAKLTSAESFNKNNFVFIYEAGHVHPGYFVKDDQEWHLYGIEMTAASDALTDYGLSSRVSGAIRVVDALLALETIAKLPQAKSVSEAIQITADHYGLKLAKLEAKVNKEQILPAGKERQTATDPFGFGNSIVQDGDIKREELHGTLGGSGASTSSSIPNFSTDVCKFERQAASNSQTWEMTDKNSFITEWLDHVISQGSFKTPDEACAATGGHAASASDINDLKACFEKQNDHLSEKGLQDFRKAFQINAQPGDNQELAPGLIVCKLPHDHVVSSAP